MLVGDYDVDSSSSSSGSSAAGAGLSTVVAPGPLARRNASMIVSSGISSWASTTRDGGTDSTTTALVGAGDDDDRVLPVVIDRDQRPAAREVVDDPDPGVVDPVLFQHVTQPVARHRRPERSDECDGGAGPSGGDRLVEALASGVLGVRAGEHGLAGRRRGAAVATRSRLALPTTQTSNIGVDVAGRRSRCVSPRSGRARRSVRSGG